MAYKTVHKGVAKATINRPATPPPAASMRQSPPPAVAYAPDSSPGIAGTPGRFLAGALTIHLNISWHCVSGMMHLGATTKN